ncbi:MAG: septum formation initiator family protein [Moraxellaceae bacterium]|nr:septum formation initiator family protein [Moraxellaceae bacterium]
MKKLIKKLLVLLAVVTLLMLQVRYWFGENGYADLQRLKAEINTQQRYVNDQAEINRVLKADIHDLKSGLEAVEEHARLDLGLIKSGETFVQISTAQEGDVIHATTQNRPAKSVEAIPEPLMLEEVSHEATQPEKANNKQ